MAKAGWPKKRDIQAKIPVSLSRVQGTKEMAAVTMKAWEIVTV